VVRRLLLPVFRLLPSSEHLLLLVRESIHHDLRQVILRFVSILILIAKLRLFSQDSIRVNRMQKTRSGTMEFDVCVDFADAILLSSQSACFFPSHVSISRKELENCFFLFSSTYHLNFFLSKYSHLPKLPSVCEGQDNLSLAGTST
jgi:hypothetical protein